MIVFELACPSYIVKGLFTDLLCNLKIEYTMMPVHTPTQ